MTHDFRDAAALADRIGVVVAGRLRQIGTAVELVDHPADPFVVSLTGGNLLTGTARELDGGRQRDPARRRDDRALGAARVRSRRRRGLSVGGQPSARRARRTATVNAITAPISALAPEGGRMRVRVGSLTAEGPREELERLGLRRGEAASASFSPADARLIALDDA